MPAQREDIHCRNCGAPAPLNFCANCGQETALRAPTLREFFQGFLGHYVALEGSLWRSLALLLLKPGALTRQYLAGRRRRYVHPLRLYLTASFAFFFVLKVLPSAVEQVSSPDAAAPPAAAASSPALSAASGPGLVRAHGVVVGRSLACNVPGGPACSIIERIAKRVGERESKDRDAFVENLRVRGYTAAPYAIFLMLPVFAAIVMLVYFRRRMTYGEHFVFSLHLHAFWFFALLAFALLPDAVGGWLLLAPPVYGVWAMRGVYGGGWWATVWRALVVSVVYGLLLSIATVALVIGLLAMA